MNKKEPPNHLIVTDFLGKGVDDYLIDLANNIETPLYIYNREVIRKKYEVLRAFLPEEVSILYSVKANPNRDILLFLSDFVQGYEIASYGEMDILGDLLNDKSNVFSGPGKTDRELRYAIDRGTVIITAESENEVNRIQNISKALKKVTPIALRINLGMGNGAIHMGGKTQFGMEENVALEIINKKYSHIEIIGLHSYFGTNILNIETILDNTQIILEHFSNIISRRNAEIKFIDIGGGVGIPTTEGEKEVLFENTQKTILKKIVSSFKEKHQSIKNIYFETGRYLVGNSGVFLAKVIDIKENYGTTYVILDGGTNVFGGDNKYRGHRPTAMRVLGNTDKLREKLSFCGPLCTAGDLLAADIMLTKPRIGDIIAFYNTGAYGLSASPVLFLSHGTPKEILIRGRG